MDVFTACLENKTPELSRKRITALNAWSNNPGRPGGLYRNTIPTNHSITKNLRLPLHPPRFNSRFLLGPVFKTLNNMHR